MDSFLLNGATTVSIMTFSITTLSITIKNRDTQYCYAECHTWSVSQKAHYSECRFAECRYAECLGAEKSALSLNCLGDLVKYFGANLN